MMETWRRVPQLNSRELSRLCAGRLPGDGGRGDHKKEQKHRFRFLF